MAKKAGTPPQAAEKKAAGKKAAGKKAAGKKVAAASCDNSADI